VTILSEARALLALLQPLTGARASGTATVKASPGPTAVLPPNTYAVPIVGGAMRFDLLLKTAQNAAAPAGWTVTTAGDPVTMISVVGGNEHNLPDATELRWWPGAAGIEAKSVLAGALTGGIDASGLTALRQVRFFEQLRADLSGTPADLFKSMVSQFPSAVLVWERSRPAPNGAKLGRGVNVYEQEWHLFLITSRADGDNQRREEGLALVDAVTEEMVDRSTVDGMMFSAASGLSIEERRRHFTGNAFYVYRIVFTTTTSVSKKDSRTFNPWLFTRLDEDSTDPLPQGPFPWVDNNRFPMPQ
jgi:hypothetical protein